MYAATLSFTPWGADELIFYNAATTRKLTFQLPVKGLDLTLKLGTSGWSYDEWVGPFYDDEKGKLTYYSKIFNTAEIDSTFYGYPSRSAVLAWVKLTHKDFTFTAKIPRVITHTKKLDMSLNVEEDLKRFLDLLEPLRQAEKLGPLLIQFPPKLEKDLDRLSRFLDILPDGYRFAIEFRHPSWLCDESLKLLSSYHVAYTIVDEPVLPPDVHITTDFSYLRWHGLGSRPWYNYRYSLDELRAWVPRIKDVRARTKTVYGYFNNHFHGYAVENCLQILKMLGSLSPEQAEALKRIERYFSGEAVAPVKPKVRLTLEALSNPVVFLSAFIDERRFKRAKEIGDEELSFEEISESMVKAKVKDYSVVIDVEEKQVMHDCADWARVSRVKRLCKHLGKVFLSLPSDVSLRILRRIYDEFDEWTFRPLMGEEEDAA